MPMTITNTSKYGGGETCCLMFAYYGNGQTAIQLMDQTGMPYGRATVALDNEVIGHDEVLIKDYSENEGMYQCLVEQGIVRPHAKVVAAGHAVVYRCELTEAALEERDRQLEGE